jgi:beta-galactosidase
MWNEVVYEPGELEVVALKNGMPIERKKVITAGEPHHILLATDRTELVADGSDLAFVTVSIVDKEGNFCPTANNQLSFEVEGNGSFKTVCNGDPTSLELFHKPTMKAFSGKLVVTVQSGNEAGPILLKVNGPGIQPAELQIITK